MPIWMPPRKGGAPPSLALRYSSSSGNGIMGVGWGLSGDVVSSITRCRHTVAEDGQSTAVLFQDDADALCLDGKRLRPLTKDHPTWWDTEFRTEDDQFTKIFGRYAEDPTGAPQVIVDARVYPKDGRRLTYGQTSFLRGYRAEYTRAEDGSVNPVVQTAVYTYGSPLDLIEYPSGGSVHMTYSHSMHDGTGGDFSTEHYLESIEYSDGFLRRIRLEYEPTRPDKFSHFISGMKMTTSRRLSAIVVESGMNVDQMRVLRRYILGYKTEPQNDLSLLTSVQECDGDGVCKTPTAFEYTDYATDFVEQKNLNITDIKRWAVEDLVDVNGDGLDDVLYKTRPNVITEENLNEAHLRYRPSTGTGFDAPIELPVINTTDGLHAMVQAADVDMDGDVDLLTTTENTNQTSPDTVNHWVLYRSTPAGFIAVDDGPTSPELVHHAMALFKEDEDGKVSVTGYKGPPRLLIGDITGDGLPEILRAQAGKHDISYEEVGIYAWGLRINENGTPTSYHDLEYNKPTGVEAINFLYGDRLLMADVDGAGRLALLTPYPDDFSSGRQYRLPWDREDGVPYPYMKIYLDYNSSAPAPAPQAPLLVDPYKVKWLHGEPLRQSRRSRPPVVHRHGTNPLHHQHLRRWSNRDPFLGIRLLAEQAMAADRDHRAEWRCR
jgi:hypothetical protein